ncbi:MAG: hypothetical protein ACKOFI_10445, partial [Phycisphaerales bacterium]
MQLPAAGGDRRGARRVVGDHDLEAERARWHERVVGIVAATVAERYGRPAILLSLRDDATATARGRSVDGVDLLATVRGAAAALM